MAVSEAINRIEYAGNNSAIAAYPVPFRFDSPAWLIVRRITNLGVVTTLTNGVDYALTGNTTTGDGEIVTTVAIPANNSLVLARYTPAFQTLSLISNSPLPAADLEAALDRIVLALQDRDTNGGLPFSRSIIFPISEPAAHNNILPNPAARKNSLIYFNSADGEMQVISMAALAEAISTLVAIIGPAGENGTDGESAYEIAVAEGFVGDINQWLISLRGEGEALPEGETGDMAYHDGEAWVVLPSPAPPSGNQQIILTHDGTAPSWVTVNKIILDYCNGGAPTTGIFLTI
jgi:hypothetical protein